MQRQVKQSQIYRTRTLQMAIDKDKETKLK